MFGYVARRALQAVPVLFGVSLISFLMVRLTPGDPIQIMLGVVHSTPQTIALWRAYYHLDDPLPLQYASFLAHALTLDFGKSIQLEAPVTQLIPLRLFTTVTLITYAMLIALVLTVPMATIAALRENRAADQAVKLATMVTSAMPTFWVGLLLVLVLTLDLHLFPSSGIRAGGVLPYIWSLTLPALVLGLANAPIFVRTLRASMIETLRADYVEAARARGLSEPRIVMRYVLRNSLVSTVTVFGLVMGTLIAGAVITESVFGLPGLGSLLVYSVGARDFPVVQALVLLVGVWIVAANLLTDLVVAALDPRIRR
jgi:peptide/nickel transport system permease protein